MKRDIERIYEYVTLRSQYDRTFEASIKSQWHKIGVLRLISSTVQTRILELIEKIVCRDRGKRKYLFLGTRFTDLILSLNREEVCVIGGPRTFLFSIKNRVGFVPCTDLRDRIAYHGRYTCKPDVGALEPLLRQFAKRILRNDLSSRSYLIVPNDSLPFERAAIVAMREVHGITTICIQDGVFQSKSPSHLFHGSWANYMLVINAHQKMVLAATGVSGYRVIEMGFHSDTHNSPSRSEPEDRKVCFLGQPWGFYDEGLGARQGEIYEQVSECLRRHGFSVAYKPHPLELQGEYIRQIKNVIRGSLAECIEEFDVFISLTSTALLEAAWAGNIGIQIIHPEFDQDCMSVHADISCVEYLSAEFCEKIVDNVYSESPPSKASPGVAARFTSAIEKIERKSC